MRLDHAYAHIAPDSKPRVPVVPKPSEPTHDVIEEIEVPVPQLDTADNDNDCDYEPPSSDSDESDEEEEPIPESRRAEDVVLERKYIIFESQLRELFLQSRCSACGSVFMVEEPNARLGRQDGSCLHVHLECLNGHVWKWSSQPVVGRMPLGNLLLSAATLYSGQTYTRISTFAGFLNLKIVGHSTFKEHQKDYLWPAVHSTWDYERQTLWGSLEGRNVRLAGDGRCDSPGYSAKFCTYSMMDLDSNKVVDFELVQVTQATSSVAMEKKGFQIVLDRLMLNKLKIVQIATDRHTGINALMRDSPIYKHIDHQFDVWHLAKNICKALRQKAVKECEELSPWIPAINNHIWWSSKTCKGDKVELLERWRSVCHHITGKHEWGANQKFHRCGHEPIPPEADRKKKWLEPDSAPHQAVCKVVNKKNLLEGVGKITNFCHTGELEVYHAMLTKYAPKRSQFPYEGMCVRMKLAVLDNNYNTGRKQAVVKKANAKSAPKGSLRYRVAYPKAKKKFVCKKIYEGKKYGYVYDLMSSVVTRKLTNDKSSSFVPPELPPNIVLASVTRPTKEDLIAAHKSRFGE